VRWEGDGGAPLPLPEPDRGGFRRDAEVVAAGRAVADPSLVEDGGTVLPVVREGADERVARADRFTEVDDDTLAFVGIAAASSPTRV